MKFINDYPYTNMTAQNIDWLIKAVVDLIHEGKTDEEIKNAPGISEAYGAFCNAYPYTNMTMQNIDWLISSVRELYDKEATLEENITKIEAQMATLQADVNNIVDKFGDKVDKLNVKNNVYVTDGSTPPKTTGIQYLESPLEGTIPIRDGIGSLQVPTAQNATQAVNKGQMDTALDGKVDKTTESAKIYGTDGNGMPILYTQTATETTLYSVPLRNDHGAIVANRAEQDMELVPLIQMNTALGGKVNKTTARQIVYARDSAGNESALSYDSEATVGVAVRGQNGVLKVGTPVANDDATTKEYVDNASNGKLDKVNSFEFAVYAHTGLNQHTMRYTANMDNNDGESAIVLLGRDSNGRAQVNEPVEDKDIANKIYVDNAIKTAPTGGWTTVIDKTWTEDETGNVISIDIPAEYQKAMSELRMTYYNNTPQAGAVYSNQFVHIRLYDGSQTLSFVYTGNILPTKDTKETTVNFQSDYNKISTVLGEGSSDLLNSCYGIYVYKDSNGNAVQPIPTHPNVLLNTSNIIGTAEVPEDKTPKVLDTCLPNRSHSYTTTSTQTTVNYTSNDYYNSGLPECIISQVLTSTDETNLPVGSFICVQRQDLKFALNVSIVFSGTASVSYKNVVTRLASIVGESMQIIAGAENIQNTMTSFNDTSINGSLVPGGYAYYSRLKNGYPTRVHLYPQSSTSNGVTAKKIYAGSRLVLQARY